MTDPCGVVAQDYPFMSSAEYKDMLTAGTLKLYIQSVVKRFREVRRIQVSSNIMLQS